MFDSLQPHGLWPARLCCPWDFSRQEYWSGLPFSSLRDLLDPGIKRRSPTCPELQVDSSPAIREAQLQFIWVAQSCLILWPHALQHASLLCPSPTPELAQTHVHQVSDAIQPSHPLLSPSSPAFSLSQRQGLSQWVSSSHQVAKVLPKV